MNPSGFSITKGFWGAVFKGKWNRWAHRRLLPLHSTFVMTAHALWPWWSSIFTSQQREKRERVDAYKHTSLHWSNEHQEGWLSSRTQPVLSGNRHEFLAGQLQQHSFQQLCAMWDKMELGQMRYLIGQNKTQNPAEGLWDFWQTSKVKFQSMFPNWEKRGPFEHCVVYLHLSPQSQHNWEAMLWCKTEWSFSACNSTLK